MIIKTSTMTKTAALFVAGAAGMLLAITLTACKSQQNLTGSWAATGKNLENGEQQKAILELKQDGSQLSGTVRGLGFQTNVKGTVNGSHFELFGVDWNDKKPFLVGDLADGKIEGTDWGTNSLPSRLHRQTRFRHRRTLILPRCILFPISDWPRHRPWDGTVGISSPTKLTTRRCAPWPTPWYRAACATPATSTSTSMTLGKACGMPTASWGRTTSSLT